MDTPREEMNVLRRLAPEDHGLTVFDADTQETSHGTLVREGLPLIFDTHRKDGWFVSTAEVLTEILAPAATTPVQVARFSKVAEHHGIQSIPYSARFFKGNLRVYAYYGPVRGFDLSVAAESLNDAETKLEARLGEVWADVPAGVIRAQRELLAGQRKARYEADLEILRRRIASAGSP